MQLKSKVKITVDPKFGVIQETSDTAEMVIRADVPVTIEGSGTTIGYSPEDPTQWSSLPTTLIQAVDYLAAGSGSGGGGGVPLNFSQTKGAQVTITAVEAKPATVVSTTITTQGNPVQIIVSGDANPSSSGSWGLLNIYRGGTAVGQLVQFESSAANENVPYCLQVVDEPAAGTWTYSLKVTSVTSDTQFGEAAGPIITVTELGAEAGGGGGGSIGGTIAVNEVAFGTGIGTISGSSNLTYNSGTQDLTVGDGAPHSIRIGPYGYVSNPIIESLDSMNINIVNFSGALGIQAANNDLVLIGGDDGGGQSYLQTQPNVRLETQGRLLVKPATDGVDGVEVRNSTDALLVQIDTSAKTTTLTGDTNSVLTLVDEIAAAPFFTATPVTRELALTDPTTLTDTTLITPTDVSVNNGTQTGNLSGGQVRVTDAGTTNVLAMSIPGGLATLTAEDGAGIAAELHVSASNLTMQSMVASGDFLSIDASSQRLTVVDPGTGADSAYLEGGRVTIDAAGNTLSFDAFVTPTITTLNLGSSLPMPLNLAIEALQINGASGSAGDVLTSSGPGAAPVWQAPTSASFGSKVLLCVEGGSYATIQAAIDAAADWDVILVGPKAAGASWGPAVFSPGKRLVVASLGSKWSTQVLVDSITFNANSGLNILNNTVFVRGLFINSSFTALAPGVNFYGSAPARLRLQECFIYNSNAAAGTGVASNNSGSGSSLYLDSCIVQSGASTGIGLDHQQGYTIIRNDSEISRYQYPLQCAAGNVEIYDSILDGTGIANEVVRMTGGLVTCGYTTIKNTTTNASGVNLTAAGAAFGMGDATFSIATGTGYCVNGVAGGVYLYGNVSYSNTAAAAYNVKVKNTLTTLAVTQVFTSSP